MLREMYDLFISRFDFFAQLTLEHLQISLVAILIAGILGLIIGILISEYEKTSGFVLSLINIIYTIPSISLLGLLIPLSGIGNTTAIIALTVYALLPMVRSTHTGIRTINPAIIEAAKGMGSTGWQILWKIQLPLALPVMLSGLRNMVVMTVALTGIASFIGAGGLGVAIYRGITTNNMAMTLIGSILIALLAFLLDFLLGAVEKRLSRRRKSRHSRRLLIVLGCIIVAVCLLMAGLFFLPTGQALQIATKPMTEQYILGEMMKAMIEEKTDIQVQLTQGVGGGTSNIQPAMENGEFDMYPEYTGTGWNAVLKEDGLYTESMFDSLQTGYNKMGMTWLGMYGFNNTYGLALRTDIAEAEGIRTYSDLARIAPGLTFGAEYDFFEREDGYDALCEAYGFSFKQTMDLDIGLKYQAIGQKEIDVMNIFTTDGQLSDADVTVLVDDKQFYPSYLCGNVVRQEALSTYPELSGILLALEGQITDADMADMNYQVDTEGKDPKEVALAFLHEKGLL